MDMAVILIGLAILLILTLIKIPVPIAGILSVLFIAIFSGMPILPTILEDYMGGMGNFVKSIWLMLLLGAILSKLMDISGAARSIATFVINTLGVKRAIPSIVIAGGLLTFGGVSSMVSCFALYPIALAIFRQADLPRYLIPGTIAAGIFTWVTMLPGNPSAMNIVPISYLNTTAAAAPVVGLVAAAVTLILSLIYLQYESTKAKKKDLHFEADSDSVKVLEKSDELASSGSLPHPLIAILPLIAVTVVLNVFNTDISVALLTGVLLCVILFLKNYKGIDFIEEILKEPTNRAATTIITASSIVGIGSVVKVAPGFQKIVDFVIGFSSSGGNALIIFGVATTLLCGLNASGLGGLSTTLAAMADSFLKLGVNPDILHRVGVIASTGLDSLPHSGGIVAVLSITGISYKDGYKHMFVTTVVITLISLAIACVLGNIMYPIG